MKQLWTFWQDVLTKQKMGMFNFCIAIIPYSYYLVLLQIIFCDNLIPWFLKDGIWNAKYTL